MSDIDHARASLLEEIGEDRDLTLVRGIGNIGDELIRAGTHRLLERHVFREIALDELAASRGDTLLLPGSGAWCRPHHEWMPRALAIAELRFDRVIVLPSSFDVGEDTVRAALRGTAATVFARETESLARIEGLCRARLAPDCAFFFDYSAHRRTGHGTLSAFRTDREASPGDLEIGGNDDISLTALSLEDWLATIARHALVRTDRAHVMIAAALMGKEVEFAPSSYHKLEALAATSLHGYPVRQIEPPRRGRATPPVRDAAAVVREQLRAAAVAPTVEHVATTAPRVTAVVLTRDRAELAAGAVRSLGTAALPVRVLLLDNNSDATNREQLSLLAPADPRLQLRLSDRNLGCAGGRALALESVDTEFVLLLDDDAELIDGALEHMVADLDAHPATAGVTACVVGPRGLVQHCGGWMEVSADAVAFGLDGTGLRFDDPSLPPSGPSGWAPGTASLLRTEALREVPIDADMAVYYEDNDWCFRVERAHRGSFRRCREALVLHHHDFADAAAPSSQLVRRYDIVERLATQSHFLRANGLLLDVDLAAVLPELQRRDGRPDLPAVRLLLELVAARGVDWTVAEWMSGGLDTLLEGSARAELGARAGELAAHVALLEPRVGQLDSQVAALSAHAAGLETLVSGLRDEVAARAVRAAALEAEAAALHADLATRGSQLAAAVEQAAAAVELAAALETRELEGAAHLAWLNERHATLCKIEAGGWWRLRSRLLPLLRVAARVREATRGRT